MLYSSTENKKIKELKKLEKKKYRDLLGIYLVETEHLINEAYKTNCLEELLVLENNTCNLDVKTNYVTRNVMNYLTNLDSKSNMIGIVKKNSGKLIGDKIVILDNIQDPGNLGTIIRTCKAFNVDTLVISEDSVDLYNDKTIRASEGMIFKTNIVVGNIKNIINELKGKYTIYGTKVINGKSLKTIEKNNQFVIIMGNEGNGVSDNILSMCDEYIYIDMNDTVESLNVGVATGIILYEFNR